MRIRIRIRVRVRVRLRLRLRVRLRVSYPNPNPNQAVPDEARPAHPVDARAVRRVRGLREAASVREAVPRLRATDAADAAALGHGHVRPLLGPGEAAGGHARCRRLG